MEKAYLSLGSNLGDRQKIIETAIALLGKQAGEIIRLSSFYETLPWKMEKTNNFINAVVIIETGLDAEKLLDTILSIEKSMGRIRTKAGYEPRIIDIDIIFYGNEIINTPRITIPHPLLQERRFILDPLHEIAPDYVHPVLKKTVKELLKEFGARS